MPLGIDFWKDLDGFLVEDGGKLAPKSELKSMLPPHEYIKKLYIFINLCDLSSY